MAKGAQELYDFLQGMNRKDAAVMPGIVKAVNSDDTLEVDSDGLTFYDVRQKAAVKEEQKGLLYTPVVGSVVIIERIGDDRSTEYQVVLYSELESWSIEIITAKLLMDAEGFLMQKGSDSLKEILTLIIEAVQAIIVIQGHNPDRLRLQQAMNKVNNLLK